MSHDHHHHGAHAHDPHGHDHHGHDHAASSQSRVLLTFWLITLFMGVEAVGGWWSGSLTLLADSGHMLTDSAALALAWLAARAMRRPSDAARSYGHDRFSVLAALINGLGLIAIVLLLAAEAVHRLLAPEPIRALPMLAIAVAGFLVNTGAFFLLHGADRDNINIRAAILHVLGDMLASLAAVAAAAIILLRPGWVAVDPILSVVAGGLILRGAIALVRRAWHVLMEGTPDEVDVPDIEGALEALDGVADIHHLHAWSLAPGKPLITLHAQVTADQDADAVLARIKHTLTERFHIDHSTIQMERACADGSPDHAPGRGRPDHGHSGHSHSGHDHARPRKAHDHDRKLAATR
jgi:cobalt-zinc-cadmium efflux system protein